MYLETTIYRIASLKYISFKGIKTLQTIEIKVVLNFIKEKLIKEFLHSFEIYKAIKES